MLARGPPGAGGACRGAAQHVTPTSPPAAETVTGFTQVGHRGWEKGGRVEKSRKQTTVWRSPGEGGRWRRRTPEAASRC